MEFIKSFYASSGKIVCNEGKREMTETTEEDVGFPGSTFGFILERQQMAGQASAVQRFQRELLASRFPFVRLSWARI